MMNPLIYIYHDIPDFGGNDSLLLENLAKKNTLIIPKIE